MKKILFYFTMLLFIASCATPTVVQVVAPTDSKLTCNQIDTEIAMANKYAADAKFFQNLSPFSNFPSLFFSFPFFVASPLLSNVSLLSANLLPLHLPYFKTQNNFPSTYSYFLSIFNIFN